MFTKSLVGNKMGRVKLHVVFRYVDFKHTILVWRRHLDQYIIVQVRRFDLLVKAIVRTG